MLIARTLTAQGAQDLQGAMRKADLTELAIVMSSPLEAMSLMLLDALSRGSIGEAWEIINYTGPDDMNHCVGAFGYHISGCQIYSLWAPLNRGQARQILKEMPKWVKLLVNRSRCTVLSNLIHAGNRSAVKWLVASKCFEVDFKHPITISGRKMFYFQTRRLEEMP